ncbi:AMP-dependent synthetase [Micractinium conductrix]|uniref:AMP-dependent synthetase n=1 Tax=Micractinium conductrix TaxID=554055 RepID=A0A2P6V013_9CHLO|nr:AMP-dependent synthetase [Micractinium conductrix]|eukprot:PSC67413.1 AMP-dependent synthetase [Micractinium conductrix]
MSLVVVLLMGGVRSPLPAADGTEPADLQGRRGGRQLLGAAVQPWRVENGFVVFDAPVNFTSDVTANSKVDLNGMTYVQWLRVDDLARLYKVIIEGSVSIKRSLEVNETAFVRGDLQTENLVVGGGAEIGSQYRGQADYAGVVLSVNGMGLFGNAGAENEGQGYYTEVGPGAIKTTWDATKRRSGSTCLLGRSFADVQMGLTEPAKPMCSAS